MFSYCKYFQEEVSGIMGGKIGGERKGYSVNQTGNPGETGLFSQSSLALSGARSSQAENSTEKEGR